VTALEVVAGAVAYLVGVGATGEHLRQRGMKYAADRAWCAGFWWATVPVLVGVWLARRGRALPRAVAKERDDG
jgi:hypothetical protein